MKRKRKQAKKGSPPWMTTYSDLMSLLLVFFIMLFAASEIDVQKFNAIAESFQNRAIFDFYPSIVPFDNPAERAENIKNLEVDEWDVQSQAGRDNKKSKSDQELAKILKVINTYLEENQLKGVVTATRTEQGVVMVLQDQVLYNSGSAELRSEALPLLTKIADLISAIPNQIKVEGHTDSDPIVYSHRYPSNWELSTARASTVIRYFIDEHKMDPSRFVAVGYADQQPVASNDSAEGKQQNRRVVIVIADPYADQAAMDVVSHPNSKGQQ
ncbi:flagellar motor protein MotS [Rubeoparvulum massiliense]|uniref:flagellar motor protein MotS n=1 Tax=Rubeoparvulum massiliense TaxID=1631346 RepID=UPI00065E149B|nr:flagellar motor protein MotS [Rubeoparvulum massiliense]